MKRTMIVFAAGFFVLLAVPALVAQEDTIRQFDRVNTVRDRLGIVQNAAEDGSGTAEFYAYALNRLLEDYRNVAAGMEKKYAGDMAKLLCEKLGEADQTDAGLNLWRVVQTFEEPLIKAEALKALGKVQAVEYLPQVIQVLSNINNAPTQDRLTQEQTAYGAVESLEAYKNSSGYLPVFFASTGWYSERVRDRARRALPVIMDNPSEPLVSVIRSSSYGYSVKLTALQILEGSDITSQQKATGAVVSLAEAWRSSTNVGTQRSILVQTRKLALGMIRRYGTEDSNVYQYLERCYREGADEEEQIAAVAALSALASDDSARKLSLFLEDINDRLRSGTLNKEDERLIRVIIPALGSTARPLARGALRSVMDNDWTGAVHKLAQDALKKIQ